MNPIMQMLNQSKPQNNVLQTLNMIKNGDPEALYQKMMNENPRFRAFVEENKGKTPEQIARENGIDLLQVQNLLR